MSAGVHVARIPEPLTLAQRAAVGEDYYRRCYRYAMAAAVVLSATAVVLAYGDGQRGALAATSAVAVLVAAVAIAASRVEYDWLRRYPYVLALAGPLVALVCLWHATDANALYFPALAPLAIIPCVAQARREQLAVIGSLAVGTFLAALEDTRLSRLQAPGELASSTLAVLVLGVLLMVLIDWWARKVLLAPDATQEQVAEIPDIMDIRPSSPTIASTDHLERVRMIAETNPEEFKDLQIEGVTRLTGRQLQVLYLVREELTAGDIAYWLGLSPGTVRKHIQGVRERLGVVWEGVGTYAVARGLPELPEGFLGESLACKAAEKKASEDLQE